MKASLSPTMRRNAETVLASLNRSSTGDAQVRTVPDATPLALPLDAVKARGILTLMECRDGVTLSLVADGKTLKFHSTTPDGIRFKSLDPALVIDAWMRTATRQWRFRDRHLSAKGIGGQSGGAASCRTGGQ